MLTSLILHLGLILFLMVCSAFFSGSETAFFSLNRMRTQRLSTEGNRKAKIICELLEKPRHLILTILFGNDLINISVSSVATSFWIIILGDYGPAVAFPTMVILLVIFCEITPKSYAIRNPEKFSFYAIDLFKLWYKLLAPFRIVFIKLYVLLFKLFRIDGVE